ncbi:MAG: 16S rRNA (adenine(1518)-N(6)/adenine(1519)-N(6))-dimethyltransferase RsmA [Kiritimatiellales bacterium]
MLGKLTSPSVIKALLDSLDHRPNKGLGQNYLIDSNILGIIVAAAEISPTDQLLEVGPGLGALTQVLLATGAKLIAVEKDQTMVAHLKNYFAELELLEADVLDVNLNDLFAGGINKIVANLPYSAGSRFIVNALEAAPLPERMVFMVQREVADRLTAQPGSKTFGPLAIWSQLNYAVKNIKNVSPTCFMPAPKVWSAVVRFEKRAAPLANVQDYERFKKLIKLCFTQRRKQIGTILRTQAKREGPRECEATTEGSGNNAPEFFQCLEKCEIDPAARPEQIPIEKWVALANAASGI